MKILHLISSGGLFGAENIVLSLARGLNDEKTTSIVGALHNHQNPNLAIIEKAKSLNLPTFVLDHPGRINLSAIGKLENYIRDEKIDIVHTHNYKSDMVGYFAARLAGVPVVATAHGFTDTNHTVSLYERLDRWVLNRFDHVVVVTDKLLRHLSPQKRHVIANGIDTELFYFSSDRRQSARHRFGFDPQNIVVGIVGRLSKEKNQSLLLKSAAVLAKQYPQLRVLLIGGGPEEENLRRLIQELNITSIVRFTGILSNLEDIYPAMDVFVLSSLTEGVPLTILEAMASHVPVVATSVGGIDELMEDQKTGLLLKSFAVEELVDKIRLLIEDQSLHQKITANADLSVRTKFSLKEMIQQYKKIYEDSISRASSSVAHGHRR
ncbi:MAG: glycosyltransferase [Candidatus Omnitrophica bacterium]|nr:glycosyltransferase [Candidatus Omnitrophota bacterium]